MRIIVVQALVNACFDELRGAVIIFIPSYRLACSTRRVRRWHGLGNKKAVRTQIGYTVNISRYWHGWEGIR